MGMLGNSTRGLPPLEKRLLYRACVLPIATYSFRLWFFEGAKNKTAFKILVGRTRKKREEERERRREKRE